MRVITTFSVIADDDPELILCTRGTEAEAVAWMEAHRTRLKYSERARHANGYDADDETKSAEPMTPSGPIRRGAGRRRGRARARA